MHVMTRTVKNSSGERDEKKKKWVKAAYILNNNITKRKCPFTACPCLSAIISILLEKPTPAMSDGQGASVGRGAS